MKKMFIVALLLICLVNPAHAIQEIQKEVNCAETNKVKDAIVSVVGKEKGIRINHVSEYQLVFEFNTKNDAANLLFMNLRTGIQPVGRIYFDLIPMSEQTLIKTSTAFVENPGTSNEIVNRNIGNKNDERILHNILEKVASIVDKNYQPEYIEKKTTKNKTKKMIETPKEKELGLVLGENGGVIDVKPGSAAHGKIAIGDAILEINGMSLNGMDREAVKTYIANKWGSGASLIMLVQHDGEKNFVSLKKGE